MRRYSHGIPKLEQAATRTIMTERGSRSEAGLRAGLWTLSGRPHQRLRVLMAASAPGGVTVAVTVTRTHWQLEVSSVLSECPVLRTSRLRESVQALEINAGPLLN